MLPTTFYLKLQGFYDHQQYLQICEWERTRTLASILISPHLKKGRRITPKQLIPLPWDKKETEVDEAEASRAEQLTRDVLYNWGELENPDNLKLNKLKNKK